MPVQLKKRQFNVNEYYKMAEAGILSEDDRVELIHGEIIQMTPIGSRHAGCVTRLSTLFHRQIGENALVYTQNPIRLNEYSEPQPDVALLKPRNDFYSDEHPSPADVLLVIEVSDSTLKYDREIKLPIYADASIQEVWVVNLSEELVEVYKDPRDSMYREVHFLKRGDSISPDFSLNLAFPVGSIFG